MLLEIKGINIFYERERGENLPVLILHGWGCDVNVMRRIFYFLAQRGHDVVSVDLPGFGRSGMPRSDYTIFDYSSLIEELIKTLFRRPVALLGHSFGGRIAIILGSSPLIDRLILVAAAGMKPRRRPSYYIRLARYKLITKVLKKPSCDAGSDDYRALKPEMKRVFVSVVNTHLERQAKMVNVPTLIIWGACDDQTPPYMAKRLNRLIKGSALIMLKGCGHFCFTDDFLSFSLALGEFV